MDAGQKDRDEKSDGRREEGEGGLMFVGLFLSHPLDMWPFFLFHA